jgi:UDP-glucose 4-epimerase
VNDLFRRLNELAGNRYEEIHGPAKPGEQFRSVCSWEMARRELGWEPLVSFDDGLERTYRYFQS